MKLDDEEIARVCRLVDDVAGIQWDASKTYLIESRLPALLTEFGCQTLSDLVNLVRQGNNPRVSTAFIDAVTTRETLFFRDQGPFEALKHKCLPEILDAKAKTPYAQRLRIWSAACSSGQEPYSLGIILHELLDDLAGWDIQILATDISPAALKSAKTGIYSEFEMSRGVPQNLRDKYFTRVGDGWQVIDSVRKLVSFEHRNLLEPLANMGPFDVVFCRNVAIYFEADVRADLFERVSGVMAPHGALFVGGSENLAALGEKWKPLYHCRGIFYLPNRKNVGPVASVDVVGPGKTALATASRAAQPPARHLTSAPASPARPAAVARPTVQVAAGRAAPPAIGNRPPSPAAGTPVARPASTATPARPVTPPVQPAATSNAPSAATRPTDAPVDRPGATSTTPVRPSTPAVTRPAVTATNPTSTTASALAKPATATARTALTGSPTGSPPKTTTAAPAAKLSTTAARPGVSSAAAAESNSIAPQPAAVARPATSARPATTQAPVMAHKPAALPAPKPQSTTTARPATTMGTTGTAKAAPAVRPAIPAKPAAAATKPAATTTAKATSNAVTPPKHLAGRPAAPAAKPR